jgi:hypothetical protein
MQKGGLQLQYLPWLKHARVRTRGDLNRSQVRRLEVRPTRSASPSKLFDCMVDASLVTRHTALT